MKNNLLCTFSHKNDIDLVLDYIKSTFTLDSNLVYIIKNIDIPQQYYITYNVLGDYKFTANTISMHRKSETNTLYTINALNVIIKKINNGLSVKNYPIPWENYRNMMILTHDDDIIRHRIKVEKVLNFSEINNENNLDI